MACGATEVDQTTFSEQDDVLAVHRVHVHLRFDGVLRAAVVGVEPRHVNLVVEVSDVAYDGFVLHRLKVLPSHDVLVSGGGDDNVRFCHGIDHLLDFEALHGRLKRANGIDFCHNHTATCIAKRLSRALAHIAITRHSSHLAGHHHVRRTTNRVNTGFTAAILVVKLRLGHGIVHVDGRHWKCAVLLTLVQAKHTGRGLFRNALDALGKLGVLVEDDVGQITAIVENHVQRLALFTEEERLLNAPLIFLLRHAFPSIDWNSGSGNGSSGVILSRKNVARRPRNVRSELH